MAGGFENAWIDSYSQEFENVPTPSHAGDVRKASSSSSVSSLPDMRRTTTSNLLRPKGISKFYRKARSFACIQDLADLGEVAKVLEKPVAQPCSSSDSERDFSYERSQTVPSWSHASLGQETTSGSSNMEIKTARCFEPKSNVSGLVGILKRISEGMVRSGRSSLDTHSRGSMDHSSAFNSLRSVGEESNCHTWNTWNTWNRDDGSNFNSDSLVAVELEGC